MILEVINAILIGVGGAIIYFLYDIRKILKKIEAKPEAENLPEAEEFREIKRISKEILNKIPEAEELREIKGTLEKILEKIGKPIKAKSGEEEAIIPWEQRKKGKGEGGFVKVADEGGRIKRIGEK